MPKTIIRTVDHAHRDINLHFEYWIKSAWKSYNFHSVDEQFSSLKHSKKRRSLLSVMATDLHVLKKFQDPSYPVPARIIWIILILLCFAVTLAQISDRLLYFMSQPVAISIQILRNETMEFPLVTLCNKARFQKSSLERMYNEFHKHHPQSGYNISLDHLIDEYGIIPTLLNVSYDIPSMLQECFVFRDQACNQQPFWTPVFTALGLCYTYSLGRPMTKVGPYQAFYFVLNGDEETKGLERGWKILIHEKKDIPDLLILSNGLTLYPHTRSDFLLTFRQFISLNRASKVCNTDSNYSVSTCEANCFYRTIAKGYSCRLPNMKLPDYPICNSSITYNELLNRHDILLKDAKWNPSSCKCPKPCNELLFTTKFDMRYMPTSTNDRSIVKIYYEDMTYERVEENFSYGIVSLLCDIGGNLGLFLGACVISIFEVFEIIAGFLFNKISSLFFCGEKVQPKKCKPFKVAISTPK